MSAPNPHLINVLYTHIQNHYRVSLHEAQERALALVLVVERLYREAGEPLGDWPSELTMWVGTYLSAHPYDWLGSYLEDLPPYP